MIRLYPEENKISEKIRLYPIAEKVDVDLSRELTPTELMGKSWERTVLGKLAKGETLNSHIINQLRRVRPDLFEKTLKEPTQRFELDLPIEPSKDLGLSRIGERRTSTLAMAGGDAYLPVLEKVARGFLDTFLPAVRPTLEKYMTGKSLVQSYRETWREMDESRKSKEEEVKQRVVEAQEKGASSLELSKIAIESPAMQLMEQTAVGFMGGIKFVSSQAAKNIMAQAVKSKMTRQDLINITKGTMKDTVKLDAYKVMTTNPQMKAELLRVAQNKKLPATQRLSEYLETKLTSKDIASFKLKTETKIPVAKKPLELPTTKAIPKELEPMAKQLRADVASGKIKNAEEFVKNLPRETFHKYNDLVQSKFGGKEFQNGFQNFYTQATKGVEAIPEAPKAIKEAIPVEKGVAPKVSVPDDIFLKEVEKEIKGEIVKKRFGFAQKIKQQDRSDIKTLKQNIKSLNRGVREGTILTKEQIENTQGELVKIIKESGLELKDQAKFISTIKNIQTPLQLAKALPNIQNRIVENIESEIKREVQALIDKELKYTKPIKVGDKRVGKYDYESNKFFDGFRENNKLNQEESQIKLNELPTENLSEADLINSRFLSLKANGMKSSLELYDKVISDIQRMKLLGETAKDDIDFEKKLNRQQKVDNVSENIVEVKGDKDSLITKMENIYREGFTNLYSMMNSIAGKKVAIRYDPQLPENRKETAIFFETKNIVEDAVKIYEYKNRKEFEGELQNLSKKEFELTDRDGLKIELGKIEIIDVYNSVKNPLIKERYDNAFGKDQVESLLSNLTAKEIEFAERMQESVQGYREILNKRSIEITGRDMGEVENYWPATSEFEPNVFDDIRLQGETPSAMKARSKSSLVFPVPKNAWLKTLKHMNQAEHVSHLSRRYEELRRIFTNRKIKNQVTAKFGESVYNSLMQHIDYISLNKNVERLDMIANIYDKALNNWVKAKIAAPTVFVRQLGSMLNYWEDMPAGEFAKYYGQGLKNPIKTFNFMWENAPFLEARFNRGYSEALKDAIKGANGLSVNMSSLTKGTTAMVRSGDITAIIYGGYPVIMSEMAKHGNMQRAVDVFERRTLQAQQAGVSSSLSHFQNSSNPFAKTLLRFKNTLNQYTRKQADAILDLRNGRIGPQKFAKTTFIYSIYAPFIYILLGWGVTQGFKAIGRAISGNEDEDEPLWSDILEQIAINVFQVVPLLDDLSSYLYRKATGKKAYGVFQTPMIDEVGIAFQKLTKKEPSFMDFIEAFSALQEPATGIPTQAISRYYKYIVPEEKKSTTRDGGSSMKDILKTYGLPELPKLPSLPGLPSIR